MADLLTDNPWTGPVLWVALYLSDYLLTVTCARLYQAQDKLVFEGSYEITPLFQADVNALRRISPRFLLALAVSAGYLVFVRSLAGPGSGLSGLYLLVLGAMIVTQATVHIRHFRNWYLFARGVSLLRGRVEYPRSVLLRSSALELGMFAVLYTGLFLATASLFVLGGAMACAGLAFNHYRLAQRHEAAARRAA